LKGFWNPNDIDVDFVDVVKVAWDMILSLKKLCKLVKNLSMVHNCGALYQSLVQKNNIITHNGGTIVRIS
jgi:hypothetical protein